MKYSIRYSDAIHILAYIEICKDTNLSSETIAKSVETNAANVRKIMSMLRNSDLIKTQNGKAAPRLARPAEKISLLDIYRSIEGEVNILQVDKKTAPACIVGGNIQQVLNDKYTQLQEKVEAEMATISLADVIHDIAQAEVQRHPANETQMASFL